MSIQQKLSEAFSEDELQKILLDAVYTKCLFERPDIIREMLAGAKGGDDMGKVASFIQNEKLRTVLELAEQTGVLVGVVDMPIEDPLSRVPVAGTA